MKLSEFKKIVKEDFDVKDQPLIEKLSAIFNLFQEQIYYAFNNNITFSENLNTQIVTFRTRVNDEGVPTGNNQIKWTLKTRPTGHMVINVSNLTDTTLLAEAPFLLYSFNNNLITIKQVTGLLGNKDYDLTIMFIG